MTHRTRGFSLIEIVVSVAILALLLALSIQGLSNNRERAQAEGVARVVASEIESARMKAIRSGHPVAFCFPSDNGNTPLTQSFYLLEGFSRPKRTKTRTLAGDFPNAVFGALFWGSSASLESPDENWDAERRKAAGWLGSEAGSDQCLVFLPSGAAVGNDLPLTDGWYRILVARSVKGIGDDPGGTRVMDSSPELYSLDEAFGAHTILVSTRGEIVSVKGVHEADDTMVATARFENSHSTASLAAAIAATAATPVIESIFVSPEPKLRPKATVQKDRNLTLVVRATDSDSDSLSCTWVSHPRTGRPEKGAFSLSDDHPMLWNEEEGVWESHATWTPPPGAQVGDEYVLECHVSDQEGHVQIQQELVLDPVTVSPSGKIFFQSNPGINGGGGGAYDIYSINEDGTDLRVLVGGDDSQLGGEISPDGSMIAYTQGSSGGGVKDLWIARSDGSSKELLLSNGRSKNRLTFTPNGNRIIVQDGGSRLLAVAVDGSGTHTLAIPSKYSTPDPSAFGHSGNLFFFSAKASDSTSQRDIVVAEYVDDGVSAPFLRNVSNLTRNHVRNGRQNFGFTIPRSSPVEFIYGTSAGGTNLNLRATLTDSGSGSSRFSLTNIRSRPTNPFPKLVFSPSGDRVVQGGLYVYDWVDDGSPWPIAGQPNVPINPSLFPGSDGVRNVKAWIP